MNTADNMNIVADIHRGIRGFLPVLDEWMKRGGVDTLTQEEFTANEGPYMDLCDHLRVASYFRYLTDPEKDQCRFLAELARRFDCVGVAPLPKPYDQEASLTTEQQEEEELQPFPAIMDLVDDYGAMEVLFCLIKQSSIRR